MFWINYFVSKYHSSLETLKVFLCNFTFQHWFKTGPYRPIVNNVVGLFCLHMFQVLKVLLVHQVLVQGLADEIHITHLKNIFDDFPVLFFFLNLCHLMGRKLLSPLSIHHCIWRIVQLSPLQVALEKYVYVLLQKHGSSSKRSCDGLIPESKTHLQSFLPLSSEFPRASLSPPSRMPSWEDLEEWGQV